MKKPVSTDGRSMAEEEFEWRRVEEDLILNTPLGLTQCGPHDVLAGTEYVIVRPSQLTFFEHCQVTAFCREVVAGKRPILYRQAKYLLEVVPTPMTCPAYDLHGPQAQNFAREILIRLDRTVP